MEVISMNIGERLKKLRLSYSLTQGEVAKQAGISQQSYSYYENNMRLMDSETLKKISLLYGVSADYILGIDEEVRSVPAAKTVSFSGEPDQMDKLVENVIKRMYEKISEDGDRS